MSALDVWHFAADLLDAAVDALDLLPAEDTTLEGAPERAYVSPGLPALDCAQVVVWVAQAFEAGTDLPGGPAELAQGVRARTARVNMVTYRLQIARCAPTPTASGSRIRMPSVDGLEAASRQQAADLWVLWCGLHWAARDGLIGAECSSIVLPPAQPLDPSGGYVGWTLTVMAQQDGYRPAVTS